ncbi:MAG: hypothetical protein KJ638_09595 [Chloroflexi bacterium]|nr:hypothetical protein [Chloroflexota bacterium]
MDEKTYQRWWQLHLRTARGERLATSEQAEYSYGLESLDKEEKGQIEAAALVSLRRIRDQIMRLQTNHARLAAKSARFDEKIATLESAYRSLTSYELDVEIYAPSQA